MAEPSTAERCWIIRRPGQSDEAADERHYTEQQARDEARILTDDGETVTVEQVLAPCITLRCQGCGYWVDEDDEGVVHFESDEQAHEYVLGWNYEGIVFAGNELIRCGPGCPGEGADRG
ncbi:hypothetical protein E1287_25775 [Actinomadura sp. KC06]|uniref:hypothetical protein n=1 Tax=Actinomadura sp. KC06 TaxID=2530369 RepID=UPI00105178CD|nr:hypothetical protein [Actinomadura sp. KC06]TDD31673.1 hypothetical protein E1287_25775 [Actinomadura sp. KC06]